LSCGRPGTETCYHIPPRSIGLPPTQSMRASFAVIGDAIFRRDAELEPEELESKKKLQSETKKDSLTASLERFSKRFELLL